MTILPESDQETTDRTEAALRVVPPEGRVALLGRRR